MERHPLPPSPSRPPPPCHLPLGTYLRVRIHDSTCPLINSLHRRRSGYHLGERTLAPGSNTTTTTTTLSVHLIYPPVPPTPQQPRGKLARPLYLRTLSICHITCMPAHTPVCSMNLVPPASHISQSTTEYLSLAYCTAVQYRPHHPRAYSGHVQHITLQSLSAPSQ